MAAMMNLEEENAPTVWLVVSVTWSFSFSATVRAVRGEREGGREGGIEEREGGREGGIEERG